MTFWRVLVAAELSAGCVLVARDPARDVVSVSAAHDVIKTAPDATTQKLLMWNAEQIRMFPTCEQQEKDIELAGKNRQIGDWRSRCQPNAMMTPVWF